MERITKKMDFLLLSGMRIVDQKIYALNFVWSLYPGQGIGDRRL